MMVLVAVYTIGFIAVLIVMEIDRPGSKTHRVKAMGIGAIWPVLLATKVYRAVAEREGKRV